MSGADTGGIKGGLGLAEDPSRFSIACRAVGPIAVPQGLPKSEVITFTSASLFFKTFQIHRASDAEKNVLVYTVVSTELINGSPFNSISVVPAGIRLDARRRDARSLTLLLAKAASGTAV